MVWVVPIKRTSWTKNRGFSKYTDVLLSPYFLLQQRKAKINPGKAQRPGYRIITSGAYPRYIVAYGNDLEQIKAREWKYILEELPYKMSPTLTPKQRQCW